MIVEILDRRGHVTSRVRLDELPATIGRAYDNAVILDDRFVCPAHVRIERDEHGRPVARDLGSVNGLYVLGQPRPVPSVDLTPGTAIRIGRTVLRFRDPSEAVPPAVPEGARRPEPHELVGSRRVGWGVIGGSLVLYAGATYLGATERVGAAEIGSMALAVFLMLLIWAGVWAFVSRVTALRFAFLGHLAWVSAIAVLGLGFGSLADYAEFLLPASPVRAMVVLAGWTALGALLLYGHLGLTTALSARVRATASAAVAAGVLALVGLAGYAESGEFTAGIEYSATLKPVPTSLVPTLSLDGFFERANALRDEVDGMLEE